MFVTNSFFWIHLTEPSIPYLGKTQKTRDMWLKIPGGLSFSKEQENLESSVFTQLQQTLQSVWGHMGPEML